MSAHLVTEVAPGYRVEAHTNPDNTVTCVVRVPGEPDRVCASARWEHVDMAVQYVSARASAPETGDGNPFLGLMIACLLSVLTSGAFWLGWLLCR